MDIAFQGQKGEWLFLITIVYIDTTGKSKGLSAWWEGAGRRDGRLDFGKMPPDFT